MASTTTINNSLIRIKLFTSSHTRRFSIPRENEWETILSEISAKLEEYGIETDNLYWIDSDGDKILLANVDDLKESLANGNDLKLTVNIDEDTTEDDADEDDDIEIIAESHAVPMDSPPSPGSFPEEDNEEFPAFPGCGRRMGPWGPRFGPCGFGRGRRPFPRGPHHFATGKFQGPPESFGQTEAPGPLGRRGHGPLGHHGHSGPHRHGPSGHHGPLGHHEHGPFGRHGHIGRSGHHGHGPFGHRGPLGHHGHGPLGRHGPFGHHGHRLGKDGKDHGKRCFGKEKHMKKQEFCKKIAKIVRAEMEKNKEVIIE